MRIWPDLEDVVVFVVMLLLVVVVVVVLAVIISAVLDGECDMKCISPIKVTSRFYNYKKLKDYTARGSGIVAVPCGQCKNCRINQSRIWVNRIMLEQTCHGDSCFVTLTYDKDNLPDPPDVNKKHLQDYLKRLRYYIEPNKIRYFGVGEYGDRSLRPHYHLIIFGIGMMSEKVIKKAWKYADPDIGIHIGELNKDSARYITGYIVKKIDKTPGRDSHPTNYGLKDEFMIASRGQKSKKGAIGYEAIKKIAKQLKDNKHWKNRVITEIGRGNKRLPLGRYLSNHLMDKLGVDEKEILCNFMVNQELYFLDCNREKEKAESWTLEKRGII